MYSFRFFTLVSIQFSSSTTALVLLYTLVAAISPYSSYSKTSISPQLTLFFLLLAPLVRSLGSIVAARIRDHASLICNVLGGIGVLGSVEGPVLVAPPCRSPRLDLSRGYGHLVFGSAGDGWWC